MTTRPILQLGNPLLWQPSTAVADHRDPEVEALARDLEETLAAFRAVHGVGRGIAAPQIGVLRRVIFIRMQPTGFAGPLINPRVVWAADEKIELWDDCFSFPRLLVKVRRSKRVRVAYLDREGEAQTIDAEGDLSELLQHEIDHLDGILAVQRAISPRAFATREEWERRYRQKLSSSHDIIEARPKSTSHP